MLPEKRILVFPFGLLSHYLRCIVFADRFYDRKSYEVLFLSHPSYDAFVKKAGYGRFSCDQFNSEEVMRCSEKFDFSWLNEKDIERIFLAQLKAIEKYLPHVVIGDVSPTLKMAAELKGVEYHSLMNGYMTKYYSFTRSLSRRHPAYRYFQKIPLKYSDKLTDVAEAIAFRFVHRPFKKIRKKYKLKSVSNYLSEMEGDQNFICDLPQLFPQKALPVSYKIIGPLLYNSGQKEGEWLSAIDRTKPVICVCMGSTGNWDRLKFLNEILFAAYTIITAGDTEKVLSAPHIISKNFLNLNDVLKVSDLMICHGGNGTIYYGLKMGVFMLCRTSHFEQEWNVHALERIAYGKSANDFSADDWKDNIELSLRKKLKPYFST